nr:hypothetical protein [Tanacetum cinerariifolium]
NNNKDAHADGKEHDDIQNATGPSNTTASPPVENSALQNVSTSSHYVDMPNLEDYTHSDDADDVEDIIYSDDEDVVGAEVDFNNLEPSIPVSPIPTTSTHKDHPILQIIGDLSLTTQTRSITRAVTDQGALSQMFGNDFHTFMFAC